MAEPLIIEGTPTRVIGILGGVSSGKSEAAGALVQTGCAHFDADEQAKAQLLEPEVLKTLVEWWGDDVLDVTGELHHDAIATIIFNDPDARRRLEELIHPRVREAMHQAIRDANAQKIPAIVLDIPLLYEAKLDSLCNVVLFIDSPDEARIERAVSHRGWSPDEVKRREAAQIPLEEKRRRADHIIHNDTTLEALQNEVKEWYQGWIEALQSPIED
ncbi:MAG: dephospho-CoA kinase [Planctomycetota bacterium]|jgi:dephospho-CoA kinase